RTIFPVRSSSIVVPRLAGGHNLKVLLTSARYRQQSALSSYGVRHIASHRRAERARMYEYSWSRRQDRIPTASTTTLVGNEGVEGRGMGSNVSTAPPVVNLL